MRNAGKLREAGIFYDPEGVTDDELETLRGYAEANELRLLTRDEFVDQIFFGIGWQFRASIIGFNLPFDLSRIAVSHSSARTEMRGGFSFKLSRHKYHPHVRVKHHSQRMAFIRFAAAMRQPDSRGERRRGLRTPQRAGHFVDVKTLAGALFAKSFSLAQLSTFLRVEHPKLDFDEFDGPITEDMVRYAVRDVQATWECYVGLSDRLNRLDLSDLPPEKAYSEASLGKAYMRQMGIATWRKAQPDFPPQLLGNIISSYFGGRSEVRIRREMRQVILCDFLSMYPTVCTLMGLWRFVIAEGVTWRDTTIETRALLDTIDIASLQSRSQWAHLATLVRVVLEGDIFPVRSAYSGEAQTTIGANHLSSDRLLWFTLADCVAAKLLTGKAPKIIEAMTFEPGDIQSSLSPINIAGNPDHEVDPTDTDYFRRVIELRQEVKVKRDEAIGSEREALDIEQNALKIAANATSYGIYVEVNVATQAKPVAATVYSSTGDPFSFPTDKVEEPGPYFHPLLATLITGAARLMLAIAETLVVERGLEWAFCDTDSIAIARPGAMPAADFTAHVQNIVDWFASLNPYDVEGSILKIEEVNAFLETGLPEPLYCWAISAKRYALFNLADDGRPLMRKVSAHGLGHLRPPYGDADTAAGIPTHDRSVLGNGIRRWHADLWWRIVTAALAGHPDQVVLDYSAAMNSPAISRYGATSPELLRWFKRYNRDRRYRDQVKPFGFLLALSPTFGAGRGEVIEHQSSGRRKTRKPPKPIAPFDRDPAVAVASAFDRETGGPFPPEQLETFAEALARYHIQPETKFLNADYSDRGTTRRRHVRMIGIRHIGKETNDWERQAILGMWADAKPTYGSDGLDRSQLQSQLKALISMLGTAKTAEAIAVTTHQLRRLLAGNIASVESILALSVATRIPDAQSLAKRLCRSREATLRDLKLEVETLGLRETARRNGLDHANLRRKLSVFTDRDSKLDQSDRS